ncbi:PREDICTED: F-box/kelch-repeat protein At3g06240 [Theobroma cacao]|uniref:F-box/kelch-repeat protein At3g06240 n=1 Tax=Theobroma cacao TaxID=3641 RepID=A0AB32UZ82_THECC|nr:PREDICTED: F-box/kelch-repeat protein At3g06240 [Theobroma cacao]
MTVALGYDSVNNDYKVVRVVSLYSHMEGKFGSGMQAQVHTLGMNSWREVAMSQGVNFGAIHWLGMVEKNRNAMQVELVSFDVSTEAFKLFPLPDFAPREIWPMWIDVYKNSHCVVKPGEGAFYEIWVMEEYGVQESWTRLHAIQLSFKSPAVVFGNGGEWEVCFGKSYRANCV